MTTAIRKFVLPLHRWAGLTVGLIIVWLAMTGAGMVFRTQFTPIVNQDLEVVEPCIAPLPLDALVDNARRVNPEGTLRLIWVREETTRSTLVRFASGDTVYLNPCSGAVLGSQHQHRGVFGWLEYLHRWKFMQRGGLVTGASALVFGLVIIVGGIVLWWPMLKANVRKAVTIDSRLAGRARRLNLHRTIGVWVGLIILTSALTGPIESFEWYRNSIQAVTGSTRAESTPNSTISEEAQRLSMEALWQRAQSFVPGAREALLLFPKAPESAIEIDLLERESPHQEARSILYLDAYTGAVLDFRPYAASSVGNKVMAWGLAIHKGRAGIIPQLLLLIGALAVPVLAYTGISSYLRHRLGRRPQAKLE